MATASLKNKTGKNREMAEEAKGQADNATMQASSLEQVKFQLVSELLLMKMLCFPE